MTIQIKGGSTSRMVHVAVFDATTGLPFTTAAYNDAGISLWYRRGVTGAKTAITPATQTVTGGYSSGGFITVGDGQYRLDLPDAAIATGVDEVQIGGSATAWKLIGPTVQIVGYDPRTELTTTFLAGTPQTGDSFARIGAAGAGLTAVGDTRLANLDATVSSRATVSGVWSGITATAARVIADHVLRRSWASAGASSDGDTLSLRSLLGAVAKLVNKVAISGSTLTVYQADDSTSLGTQTLTSDSNAAPITGADTVG